MFPTTRWSCVLALQDEDEAIRWRALNELLEAYRPALLHFLKAVERFPTERAEDLVQSFVADRILQGRMLEKANLANGRLRSFLLKSFQNFITSEHRRDHAQKRSPQGGPLVTLDEAPEHLQAMAEEGSTLDAAWARQTLALALDRFREECARNARTAWWDVFEARVLAPSLGEGTAWTFEDLANRHGFVKPQDAANILLSAKRAFSRTLRAVVADTLSDPEQVDEEIKNLCAALASKS